MTTSRPVHQHLDALHRALAGMAEIAPEIERWARLLLETFTSGGKVLVAGNGGSAAQAVHLSAELVGRYRRERLPLPAVSLVSDMASITAILNDYSADEVFARQVHALGRPGDALVCLSTSGSSNNVLAAARTASAAGLQVFALAGARTSPLAALADQCLTVDASMTCTIQEAHLVMIHMICEALDDLIIPIMTGPNLGAAEPSGVTACGS